MEDPNGVPEVADTVDESEEFAQCMRLLVRQSREVVETYFAGVEPMLQCMRGLRTTLERLDGLVAGRGGSSIEDFMGGVN